MYKLFFLALTLGGSLLFTPIRADAITPHATQSTTTIYFTVPKQIDDLPITVPDKPSLPDNIGPINDQLVITPVINQSQTPQLHDKLPQTDENNTLSLTIIGVITLLISLKIYQKKEQQS